MDYYIGVMSGTSLDGIDAVLMYDGKDGFRVFDSISVDFPSDLKMELERLIREFTVNLRDLGRIETYLSYCYANVINLLIERAAIDRKNIVAIGCHGQTVYHCPKGEYPFSMQLVNGNVIVAETKIRTVVDFRGMDIAFGGEGAPLVPAFHQECFFSEEEKRVILNLGGIANITILNEDIDKVIGFDTGPANCLMDLWISHIKSEKFDKDGKWARSGNINYRLLELFLQDRYFSLKPPKSSGKEYFNLEWIERKLSKLDNSDNLSPEDIQATLCELTAKSVTDAIKYYAPEIDALYVCGGGAFNSYLLERFQFYLKGVKIDTTAALGIVPKLVEPSAFAWLAKRRFLEMPGNIPSVTRSRREAILGAIYVY